ncbi:DUF4249 domain-containing protein [Marinifilum breve]|nr:DUF4249 domain-containing protein [Marinifilum breve]
MNILKHLSLPSFTNKQIIPICLLIFVITICSCTEDINVKVDKGDTRLSVEASVTSDFKNHTVILKESSDVFFNQKAVLVQNAIVTVTDGSNTYNYIETSAGHYESENKFAGEPGKTYSLSITNVDVNDDGNMEEYSASSTMKYPYTVEKIELHFDPDYEPEGDDEDEGAFWLVSLYMQDDIKTKDFYAYACSINDVLVHDTITEIIVQEDTYFNGELTKGADVGELSQAKPDEILEENDKVTLETYAITEEYYDFVSQLKQQDEGQDMFSGPPGNIASNVSNGAIGFFAVYSITRTSTLLTTD